MPIWCSFDIFLKNYIKSIKNQHQNILYKTLEYFKVCISTFIQIYVCIRGLITCYRRIKWERYLFLSETEKKVLNDPDLQNLQTPCGPKNPKMPRCYMSHPYGSSNLIVHIKFLKFMT